VRQVTNVLHKITKSPIPLFFVDLEPTVYSNEIYQLSSLLHTKIKVEEHFKSKVISQCTNCQEYDHTKTYCGYQLRYVRCGAQHQSSSCSNPCSDPPKCALCSESHSASYKGCSVYRDLQRDKKQTSKNRPMVEKDIQVAVKEIKRIFVCNTELRDACLDQLRQSLNSTRNNLTRGYIDNYIRQGNKKNVVVVCNAHSDKTILKRLDLDYPILNTTCYEKYFTKHFYIQLEKIYNREIIFDLDIGKYEKAGRLLNLVETHDIGYVKRNMRLRMHMTQEWMWSIRNRTPSICPHGNVTVNFVWNARLSNIR
ncbi:Uncharacterized protein FWK35_00026167, partial [Aphis craccivora]